MSTLRAAIKTAHPSADWTANEAALLSTLCTALSSSDRPTNNAAYSAAFGPTFFSTNESPQFAAHITT